MFRTKLEYSNGVEAELARDGFGIVGWQGAGWCRPMKFAEYSVSAVRMVCGGS